MKPLISVITPSFNQDSFLEQAILSVLEQGYPCLEYYIIDGGSTDNSVKIIKKYQKYLTWWVSEPDSGQAEAINKGLIRAKGEIVAWLNSDDVYLPGALSNASDALQTTPDLGFVFGNAITIDGQANPLNLLSFRDMSYEDLLAFRIICQPAVFMRRLILGQAGMLDLKYHFMLDHHLWLRMARLAPIKHVPEIWAASRHHAEAKNTSQAIGFAQETDSLLNEINNRGFFTDSTPALIRRVKGGAYRLQGRYYLDGDMPKIALQMYLRAFFMDPAYTLQHWHRIIFASSKMINPNLRYHPAEIINNNIYRRNGIRQVHAKNALHNRFADYGINEWMGIKGS